MYEQTNHEQTWLSRNQPNQEPVKAAAEAPRGTSIFEPMVPPSSLLKQTGRLPIYAGQ